MFHLSIHHAVEGSPKPWEEGKKWWSRRQMLVKVQLKGVGTYTTFGSPWQE
jgi:hypothetical protein